MQVIANSQETFASASLTRHEGQVVVFRIGEEEFGVDIKNVKEIVRLPDITPIPRTPVYVSGICNLRGNVLPVISTRQRFSMQTADATDRSRLLVVETDRVQTGLIVDSVREVMRMSDVPVEPPPSVCRGIDREFLNGIIKVNNGERLILMLNLNEVLSLNEYAQIPRTETDFTQTQMMEKIQQQAIEEQQLVSFTMAGEEYAFEILKVREILKITEVTSVPNVPSYVKGLFTIRNHLLPIVNLRELLGLPSLISECHAAVDKGFEEDSHWVENLSHVLDSETYSTRAGISKETSFSKWIENYKTTNIEIEKAVKRLKKSRTDLYHSGMTALKLRSTDKAKAISFFKEHTQPLLKIVADNIVGFKTSIEKHNSEDQRALVVEAGTMTIGFLVDWVDEVIRIPRSVIDETPTMASSDRREIRSVAKLENGERLIMIMDETALVSAEAGRILTQIKDSGGQAPMTASFDQRSVSQQSMEDQQLVTFSINQEEYGIRIMQVQEINRVSEITTVPRAPHFIDGMANLRGSVIPVIGIRSLFGLEDKPIDDRTRIIIVDVKGNKTGLRVDEVKEVLRLPLKNIERTPGIVTCGGMNQFMEGVCKLDDGKRMIVLLNVEKILDENELRALSEVVKSAEPDQIVKSSVESQKKELPKGSKSHKK